MKNVSSLKSTKTESPKTPGGISKSFLTPCRRLGLSRSWKKAGPSPFISPLSGNNSPSVEAKVEKRVPRKRKEPIAEDVEEQSAKTPINDGLVDETERSTNIDIVGTPRHVELPRKKKSKLLSTINLKENQVELQHEPTNNEVTDSSSREEKSNIETSCNDVSTPVKVKSRTKKNSPIKSNVDKQNMSETIENVCDTPNLKPKENIAKLKQTSPNELTKECIVVIQKKIFKTHKKNDLKDVENNVPNTICDSDSDDVPLSHINKVLNADNVVKKVQTQNEEDIKNVDETTPAILNEIVTIDEDDDFKETDTVKVKKLLEKNSSTGLKALTTKKVTKNAAKTAKPTQIHSESQQSSQSSFDDDEDFELDNKRTILIRKTYNKVSKPLKAKSTGSITQKDIDDLRARIESKKKLLLAKAMTEDTAELRVLIKKWQKGCQDALIELMELMKNKFPDKQNMAYSEILQMLKIPPAVVGYDSEDDCFTTPDDATIILSKFNY